MTTKIAYADPIYTALCILPNGVKITKAEAARTGYAVRPHGDKPSPAVTAQARVTPTFAARIAALPEAKTRPLAAARLAEISSEKTMTLDRAASVLRGLPEEKPAAKPSATTRLSPQEVASFRRKVEIRTAALDLNASRGDLTAASEAKKLRYALSIYDATGCAFGQAFAAVGLNARATISTILNVQH